MTSLIKVEKNYVSISSYFHLICPGVEEPPKEFDGPVMRKLIEHTQNHERESRLQQPNLRVTE